MKLKRTIFLAIFLLAAAVAMPAQELTVSPAGMVQVGTVLHFHARLIYGEVAGCELPPASRVIYWKVLCLSNSSWHTERVTPVYGEGADAWKWYDFSTTYTVTAADINNPDFCFVLVAGSNCWGSDRVYDDTKKCPPTKIVIPRIRLQKYFDCWRVPGCPNCLRLDLNELIQSIGDPLEQVQVVLLRSGQQVALLGEAGRGRKLPAQVQITLPAADQSLMRLNRPLIFQLQVRGKNGQVLASEEVSLKIR
jgi:hypothetical protein